jgi:uncharacterized membrane protein (DUF106 family)
MTNSEEWQEIMDTFQPKTEEQKRKEVEAETRRLQMPLLDIIVRDQTRKLLHPQSSDSKTRKDLSSL